MRRIEIEPLTRAAFAPFGAVIEIVGADSYEINNGTTRRYHALAEMDVSDGSGRPILSIFKARARSFPIVITMVERHPLGSQAFVPLDRTAPWLVVVAEGGTAPNAAACRTFLARGDQGVQYSKGVWHHPLLALKEGSEFLVADRAGAGANLEERRLPGGGRLIEEGDYLTALGRLLSP